MQSTAKTVTEYLQEVPAERVGALSELRDLCCSILTGFEEAMVYGMPSYARNGVVEVGFASQKNYISIYILRSDVMNAHKALLNTKGVSFGKGCIRYSKPERINIEVVALMLQATQKSTGVVC